MTGTIPSVVMWGLLNENVALDGSDGPRVSSRHKRDVHVLHQETVVLCPLWLKIQGPNLDRACEATCGRFSVRQGSRPTGRASGASFGEQSGLEGLGRRTQRSAPLQAGPHTAGIIRELRTASEGGKPVFISEYGIGSGVDLAKTTRHFEQLGAEKLEDAQWYKQRLDQFMVDWKRWNLADTFASPEDFFAQCLAKMGRQRLLGLNAISGQSQRGRSQHDRHG